MSELIDVVDVATGEVVDTRPRSEVHRDGQWHQVFHCLVLRPSAQSMVLQERSRSKLTFPGMLDLSVTGHLSAGETPIQGVREAEEELGVEVDPDALVPLGVRLLADNNGEGRNRERVHVYFLADDRPLVAYAPPPDEVSALVEVTVDGFIGALVDAELETPCLRRDALSNAVVDHTMRRDDLVEGTSGYWLTLAVMARRFLDTGQPPAI
jgi:isopentenyldiphosphate isomerase